MTRYKIDPNDPRPAYLQLYMQLREDITGGAYSYGDRLPSKRSLAEDTGSSVITTGHALELLVDEGYCVSKQRSGCYVTYKRNQFFPVGADSLPEVSESSGSASPSDAFSFSSFARVMRKVISKYGEALLIKSPNLGSAELRGVIASYLARSRGMNVTPEQIVIGSGSEYMYSLIVQMLGRDKIYGLEDPSYEQIRRVYEANGVTCELLAMGKDGIRSQALAGAAAKVLHVTPFSSYPSGVTADASKRREYIEWAKERGAVIIEDDVASEFTSSAKAWDTLFSMEPRKSVIYLNTFSVTIAPSMRAGYMVLPKDRAREFTDKISYCSCTVPIFEQYVLAEFIGSGEFERHINRVRRKRKKKASQQTPS